VTDLVFWHGNGVITDGLLLTSMDVRLERLIRFGCSASRPRCRSNLIDLKYAYTNSNNSIGSKVPFPANSTSAKLAVPSRATILGTFPHAPSNLPPPAKSLLAVHAHFQGLTTSH